jgi:hypothetical protein
VPPTLSFDAQFYTVKLDDSNQLGDYAAFVLLSKYISPSPTVVMREEPTASTAGVIVASI